MILEESNNLISQLINAGIEESEAKSEVLMLQKEFSDKNKIQEIVNERIATRKPIQYLIGKAYFMDFEVKVTPKVLIPRPETEILVEETVNRLKKYSALSTQYSALDIGTGSGAITIALCRLIPGIKVHTVDIDKDVLKIAKQNVKTNGVSENVVFEKNDLFSNEIEKIFNTNTFDLIISNPPYIKEKEFPNLEPEIYLHEPKIAHCGSKENISGLVYYERIFELAKSYPPKLLAVEIDPSIVDGIKALLKEKEFNNHEIVKDYSKLDRCLFVYF